MLIVRGGYYCLVATDVVELLVVDERVHDPVPVLGRTRTVGVPGEGEQARWFVVALFSYCGFII